MAYFGGRSLCASGGALPPAHVPALVTVLSLSVTPLQTRLFIARALARRLLALERSLGALSAA